MNYTIKCNTLLLFDNISKDIFSISVGYIKRTHSRIIRFRNGNKNSVAYIHKGKFYFGGEKPLAATTVARVFNKYIEQAGVKRIRIHDLRHSFVSMLIHLGANFMVVADLISDTVEQVLKTYGHLYQEDMTNILSKIT